MLLLSLILCRALRSSVSEQSEVVRDGRTAITLSVTHNFLLEICATPPRAVALRPSILHAGRPASCSSRTFSLRSYVRDGRVELPTTVWKTVILPIN